MAVPRSRHSNARKNKRRSHLAKVGANTVGCPNCKEQRLPHTLCQNCGHYAGRQVVNVASDTE